MANATNPTAANVTLDPELESALTLSNSDNPGIKLVSNLLIGPNYLFWTRSMTIALRAKDKLGFVIGKISKPNSDAPEYKKWITVDSMIISWILNSISRDLSDGFLYAPSAHDLWNDIARDLGKVMVLCFSKSRKNWLI
uniref:Retrotransposon Copia-like N-terminal domain-containing protein n=1 Tax=Manihot esculenta TaxID=3983 RepID=A0A2C9UW11_MANES